MISKDGALLALIKAAKPFTSGDIVDETSGTIPLMDMLRDAISDAEEALKTNTSLIDAIQECIGALADIAYSEDITEEQRRHKAGRIYEKWVHIAEV